MIKIIVTHWNHAEVVGNITNAPNAEKTVSHYTLIMKQESQLPMTVVAVKELIAVVITNPQKSIFNKLIKIT